MPADTVHTKVDFKRTMSELYRPSPKAWVLVDVPTLRYLMVDGEGNPGTAKQYTDALAALYAMSYTIKFFSKIELGRDYVVPPLEGLWWADDISVFERRDMDAWQWTMMIMVPGWIDAADIDAARETTRPKGLEALDLVQSHDFDEGLCMQKLHVGSYADEAEPLRFLHEELLPAEGLTEVGKHHEVYLSDPRKVAPEKLRTILRQPVRRI